MEKKAKRFTYAAILLLMVVVACGGCDSDSSSNPTGPLTITNVAGPWSFSGQITRNTCNLDAYSTLSGTITFTQSGSSVSTGRVDLSIGRDLNWWFYYAGTVTGNNVILAATNPYVLRSGNTVIHYGSGIDINNIQNNAGSGSLNVTGQCIEGCTGSCQTIWTGTWTKQ